MRIKNIYMYILFILTLTLNLNVFAKVDLVTIPKRDKVEITIYNSEDLTLVRDSRTLTMKNGINKLQFSWANTLIDPTSLDIKTLKYADKIDILDIAYPPRVNELGLWNITSQISGEIPVMIDYFTSGISWKAYYIGTLSNNENIMELKGYVHVLNSSGEDYENTETRLIVGKIHILDQIAELSKKIAPYGKPGEYDKDSMVVESKMEWAGEKKKMMRMAMAETSFDMAPRAPKVIKKEGLSEYFIFSIPGEEDIKTGWAKKLVSFSQDNIPIENLYKYEEELYGTNVRRFLYFKNDEEHKMGKEPLPGGMIKIFKIIDNDSHKSYIGSDESKYIPVKQKVELNLGDIKDVKVEIKRMNFKTENHEYDFYGNINGWDEVNTYNVKVKNMREIGIKLELKRNVYGSKWDLEKNLYDSILYEKEDIDTFKYTMNLNPQEEKNFSYILRNYKGTREQNR